MRAAGLAFAALLLAGCATAPVEPAGAPELRFSLPARAAQDGAELGWTLWVQNAGTADSRATLLEVQVQFYQGGRAFAPSDHATGLVEPVPVGETRSVHLQTPFRGAGDYAGSAQLQDGAGGSIEQELFFEVCGGFC